MKLWGLEPAMITAAVVAILTLLVEFGIDVNPGQQEAIKNVVETLIIMAGGVVVRSQVSPTAKMEQVIKPSTIDKIASVTKDEVGSPKEK